MRKLLSQLWKRWFPATPARWKYWAAPGAGGSFLPPPANPTDHDLLSELKGTVYACAMLNASVCASFPPRLYYRGARPPFPTRAATGRNTTGAHEVLEHPLLELLRQVNPVHNAHDLWELTAFDQEIFGTSYWLVDEDPKTGLPAQIWPLPAHRVRPRREEESRNPVDYYELRRHQRTEKLKPGRVIHFRLPDPRDPYGPGLSPLRACFESAQLQSIFLATKRSLWENCAVPGVILSPEFPLGEEERERLEIQWNNRFRHSGNGRVLVAEQGMKVQTLKASLANAAALAEAGATRDDIANAFGVPLAFLTRETNLANLQAAEHQHLSKAIRPRLRRRDEKLNEQLIPWYDTTGNLFLATPDPVQIDREFTLKQEELDLRYGVRTPEEIRQRR